VSNHDHACSFCGHVLPQSHLVQGPDANICATCLALGVRELEKRGINLPAVIEHAYGIVEGVCSLCDAAKLVLMLDDRALCESCGFAAASAFLELPAESVVDIWDGEFTTELLDRRKAGAKNSEFAGSVHRDLAVAYSEMGLTADAVLEAAFAIKKSSATVFAVAAAMRVLVETVRLERLGELRRVSGR
jgi:hypothetical protein